MYRTYLSSANPSLLDPTRSLRDWLLCKSPAWNLLVSLSLGGVDKPLLKLGDLDAAVCGVRGGVTAVELDDPW
jgi:hypothetical protein